MTTLIFGGSGGIGSAIAARVTAGGGKVHLAGRNEAAMQALALPYSRCDVLDAAQIERAVAEAGSGLQAMVYAVGSIVLKSVRTASAADYQQAFSLNILGGALALKAAAPALKANSGAALFFSSVAVGQGFANHAVIGAAKGAVEGFVRAAAADLAPHVRVNCIAPSLTRTPLASAFTSNATTADAIAKLHALERLGTPEDIAAMAALLISPDGGWVSGQVIAVDGGRSRLRTKG
jgi:NAD(P)-dependent dehydrogenase (short-subunit alcohol dehydrogenase family)